MKAYPLLAVLSLIIAIGCDRRPADEVVASVDGTVYTKSELERDVAIVEKLQALAGYPSIDRTDAAAQADYRRRVVDGFVLREILLKKDALSAKMERILREQVPSNDGAAMRKKAVRDAYTRKIAELKQAAKMEINL